MSLFDSWWMLG